PDDIIFGELDHDYVEPAPERCPAIETYIHPRFEELIATVRQEQWDGADEMALLMHEIGLIREDELTLADRFEPPQFVWEVLRGNADLTRLRNLMADKGQPI